MSGPASDPDFYGDPVGDFEVPAAAEMIAISDASRSEQFVEWLEGSARYIPEEKRWALWENERWRRDRGGEVMRLAVQFTDEMLPALDIIADLKERAKQARTINLARSISAIRAMVSLAESHPDVLTPIVEWDANPMVLGVENGVVDLKTGAFRENRLEDLILARSPVVFNAAAKCPLWDAFVAQVLPAEGLADFMNRMLGYSLTGLSTEQVFLFLYGQGMNGKSTMLAVAEKILGDYSWRANSGLVTEKRTQGDQDVVMGPLLYKRLLVASEIAQTDKLAEARVKDMTGNDRLQGRMRFGHPFQFAPTHTLWLYGNYKPRVSGTDAGIWRRMMLIPFEVKIPDAQRNTAILDHLMAESPGILNRMIQGCLEWQEQGANPPEIVLEARAQYRRAEDAIGEFFLDECEFPEKGTIPKQALYSAYNQWCESNHIRPFSPHNFIERLLKEPVVDGGQPRVDGKKVRMWKGIILNDPAAF